MKVEKTVGEEGYHNTNVEGTGTEEEAKKPKRKWSHRKEKKKKKKSASHKAKRIKCFPIHESRIN